jgi:hypothetical protein
MPYLVLQVGPLYVYIYSPERLNNTSTIFRQSFSPPILQHFQAHGTAGRGNTSDAKATEKHWKSVSCVKAPGKMIIHLWLFAHNCLPSGRQLIKRQVPDTVPCVFCQRLEDIMHTLLTCQFARVVWREVKKIVYLQLKGVCPGLHRQNGREGGLPQYPLMEKNPSSCGFY